MKKIKFPKNKRKFYSKRFKYFFDSNNNEQNQNSNEIGIGVDIQHLSSFPNDIFSLDNVKLRSSLFTEIEVVYSLSRQILK